MRKLMDWVDGSAAGYVRALIAVRRAELRKARVNGDTGASAIELAIITALIAGAAVALVAIIIAVINKYKGKISGL